MFVLIIYYCQQWYAHAFYRARSGHTIFGCNMANPALKNGYISIATELVEKFATISIPSSEMRIVWVVWRKTWGWKNGDRKKDWDWIALSQFERLTTMKHGNVAKALKSLVVKRILQKSENGYKFNQNYEQWSVCKRLPPVVKRIRGSSQTTTKISSQTHTHNRYKDTTTIDTNSDVPSHVPFSLKEEITKLETSPRRDLNIIAMYLETRRPDINSRDQLSVAIKRHLRGAKQLCPFTDSQILDAVPRAKRLTEEWTLETLTKILTK